MSRSALGRNALNRGDQARARDLLDETVAVARHYGDSWGLGIHMTLLGHAELAVGNVDRARALFDESIRLFDAVGSLMYGARSALLRKLESSLPPAHPTAFERTAKATQTALGEETFAREHAAGEQLLPVQAVDQALIAMEGVDR